MTEPKKYFIIDIAAVQNFAYLKPKTEWDRQYNGQHRFTIEDTPDNRRFISFLSRVCTQEEFIRGVGITGPK
jgi:hypothetical protein